MPARSASIRAHLRPRRQCHQAEVQPWHRRVQNRGLRLRCSVPDHRLRPDRRHRPGLRLRPKRQPDVRGDRQQRRLTYNYTSGTTPNRLDSTAGHRRADLRLQRERMDDFGMGTEPRWPTTTGGLPRVSAARARISWTRTGRRVKKTVGTAPRDVLPERPGRQPCWPSTQGPDPVGKVRVCGQQAASPGSQEIAIQLLPGRSPGQHRSAGGRGRRRDAAAYDYWPYGEILASSGSGFTPYKFTGHERDTESGFDFMQYRTYEPDMKRFLQMDPMAEKYPGLSPYAYAANNPLKFIDTRGDTLDVGGLNKGQTALSYIQSMFGDDVAQRITMGEGGRVSFDTEGLDLSEDSALELLDNLVNSSKRFLFEVVKTASIRARDGGSLPEYNLARSKLGILGASITPKNKGIEGSGPGPLPKQGYDGQVSMAPGRWTFDRARNLEMPISNVTFHELSENYKRTALGLSYFGVSGAHNQAWEDAKRFAKYVPPLPGFKGVISGLSNSHKEIKMLRSKTFDGWFVVLILISTTSCSPHRQSEDITINPDEFLNIVDTEHYGHIDSNLVSELIELGTTETDMEIEKVVFNKYQRTVTLVGQTISADRSDILPWFDVMTVSLVPSDDVRSGYRFWPDFREVSNKVGNFTITIKLDEDTKLAVLCTYCRPEGFTVKVYSLGRLLERF